MNLIEFFDLIQSNIFYCLAFTLILFGAIGVSILCIAKALHDPRYSYYDDITDEEWVELETNKTMNKMLADLMQMHASWNKHRHVNKTRHSE